jgi:hydroxymethylpyrimidine/phosphomethylpyrimidine kinase
MKRVMTIAGSDSGGGAGIQADLKTFSAFKVYGMSVLTALTAQNTQGVHDIIGLPPEFVKLQFDVVWSDMGVDAVKTGMLFNAEIVEVVSQCLLKANIPNVVADPVMVAKGGDLLLQKSAIEALKEKLLPQASLITPNIPEAEELAGFHIEDHDTIRQAAEKIIKLGCKSVLIKGGHLTGDAVDILFDGQTYYEFHAPRIESKNTHGTGCTYSSAIAANLALGRSLKDAVHHSKMYITRAIQEAVPLGQGHGPLNHFVATDE